MPLEGNALGYAYQKGNWLFQHTNISIASGEIVGLVGPSGCGKSTLGKLLAGHLQPVEGHVQLDGAAIPAGERNPVQLVLQHPEQAVNPKWKLRRTLAESGSIDANLLADFAIEDEWLNRYPGELSGGELQRICVARALGAGTRYLIADEMSTMLDAITQTQIWQSVMKWAERTHSGILVISHEHQLVNRLCSRVVEWEKQYVRV
ncbi:ATP-binding cassette domain-containing protein [Paenibacillus qinlingensis]|uniref:Peptide/nickel transport system ATP-binding protein n=1 Tax=Paenibacillus qinlingensis TaxID=1837343 RepID=A0ABU1NRK1_9BACL|nr:ATP-binding cassette domain-containing protein [Paenibacillus qinlingensis]MDR6550110.1 peptide/nickel transport system ATP-binding protein [Paenibacillus qinlingensis]